jgi:hypothetical protein
MAAGGKTGRTKMLGLFIWAMAMLIFMAALHPNGTGMYYFNLLQHACILVEGPETAIRRGSVNESLKFISKLLIAVPKSTAKDTQTKASKTRATKSQENLDKFLRLLHTQHKRWNSNQRPNRRETDKTTQNRELLTVCYSTQYLDSLQFKNQKPNSIETVLFSV